MRTKRLFQIALLAVLPVVVCCQKGQVEYNTFKKIDYHDMVARTAYFDSLSTDKKMNMYYFSQFGFEGSDYEFLSFFAEHVKADLIIERAQVIEDPMEKVGLIQALDFIDSHCGENRTSCIEHNDEFERLLKTTMTVFETDSDGIQQFKHLYNKILDRMRSRRENHHIE